MFATFERLSLMQVCLGLSGLTLFLNLCYILHKARSGTNWHVLSYSNILCMQGTRDGPQHLKEAVMSLGVSNGFGLSCWFLTTLPSRNLSRGLIIRDFDEMFFYKMPFCATSSSALFTFKYVGLDSCTW